MDNRRADDRPSRGVDKSGTGVDGQAVHGPAPRLTHPHGPLPTCPQAPSSTIPSLFRTLSDTKQNGFRKVGGRAAPWPVLSFFV